MSQVAPIDFQRSCSDVMRVIRAPLIISVGIADVRLSKPDWAAKMLVLTQKARAALLVIGDSCVTGFGSVAIGKQLAPTAGRLALVPTVDTGAHNPEAVASSLRDLARQTEGNVGWNPTTLAQRHSAASVADGVEFVAATNALWETEKKPILVQSDANPLWSMLAPDIVIIDRDSPTPRSDAKVLLRTFAAIAGLDQIDALYSDSVIDGIHLASPEIEEELRAVEIFLLPALIARGLIPAEAAKGTLRTRLGIS